MKALEKLCVWDTDEQLIDNPVHKQQHGFRTGRCTESAISGTIYFIEQQKLNNKTCLTLFLDIKGAFDNICPEHIRQELHKKKVRYGRMVL